MQDSPIPLHVLIVEDSEDDALLLLLELKKSNLNPIYERVERRENLVKRIHDSKWQLVITDHNLPGLDSSEVIDIVSKAQPDLPIIIVSGSIGEDVAVQAMRKGASDYIMKENLKRLGSAVHRELREAEDRRARKYAEATIRHMAYHDVLTGLVNRAEFEKRLQQAVNQNLIDKTTHSIFYIDLDQFKIVNDTCGHIAGDELLKQIATVLRSSVREHDIVARLGGDEFGVLLENCPQNHALAIGEKIMKEITDYRFSWSGKTFTIGVSIGVLMMDSPGLSIHEILSMVDMACYTAKDLGRNRIHLYTELDQEVAKRHGEMQWMSRINKALDENQFQLYCQKIIPLQVNNNLEIKEILIRLIENDTLIPPGAFIPAAERYNLILSIDKWVIENLFKSIHNKFDSDKNALRNCVFFVNLSGASLNQDGFFTFITRKAREYEIPPHCICFEVTETAAITQLNRTVDFIKLIRQEGFQFALDDFGVGLSSFSYLKTIPVDFIKIDGSFVRDMKIDRLDHAIVESVNKIGHIVGTQTIAEWVEDVETQEILTKLNIDFAQGFYIEEPTLFEI